MARLSNTRKSHARRAAFGILAAWDIVVFLVLASARALVPGLCATHAKSDIVPTSDSVAPRPEHLSPASLH